MVTDNKEILISNRLMTGRWSPVAGIAKREPVPVHLAIKCIDLHGFINSTMVLMKLLPLTAASVDGFVFISSLVVKKRQALLWWHIPVHSNRFGGRLQSAYRRPWFYMSGCQQLLNVVFC
jgi:hypothetical protein